MKELRGAPVAAQITARCKEKILSLKEKGVVPTLAVIRVGERSDDAAYEKNAEKRLAGAGADVRKYHLPEQTAQEELAELIRTLNRDPAVHGILLFRPLPRHMDENYVVQQICPEKDVDGMTCAGLGSLFLAKNGVFSPFVPCTPSAVLELLQFYGIDLVGKTVTVVGRSPVVGLPLAVMLMQKHATVTVCHTKTQNLEQACREADIVIAAAGRANMIGAAHTKNGQILIDVGINFVDGKMCGDIDCTQIAQDAAAVTPVPGGIGAVTTSVLLQHVVDSAEKVC